MANELDQVYFKNHIHRNLRASDDPIGEASVHGLSLTSNVQIGTTGAALKIFKLDSTGNLTTSNNFVLKGTGGAASNLVRIEGSFNVSNDTTLTGSLAIGTSGITTTNATGGYYPNITPKVEIKLGLPATGYTGGLVIRNSSSDSSTADRNIVLFFKHSSETIVGESVKFSGLISRTSRSWANQPELGFISAGSERMFLSQNGLRIGYSGDQTTEGASASDDLQVNGSSFLSGVTTINGGGQAQALRLASTGDQVYMGFYPSGIASRQAYIGFGSTGSKQLTINNEVTTGSLAISVGGSNRIRITSGGDIGFGTDSPRGDLEIGGSENKTLRIGGIFRGTGTYTGLNEETTRHQIVFSSWRDVQTDTIGAKIVAINKTNYGSPPWDFVQSTDLAFFTLSTQASSTDNTAERMRIRHNGYIGLNTSIPTSGLDVNADAVFRSGVTISGLTSLNTVTTTGALTVGGKLTFTEYNHYTPSLSTEKGYWSNTAAGPVAVTGITTTGWYKIASITCPTSGAYRGANFKGSILRYNTNWGEAIPTELFFSGRIVFYNAPSTPLQDTGVFYLTEGFNDNLLRLAKVADASWELQLGAYTTNVAIAWEVEPLYLGSQVTFTHFDRAAASLPVSIVTPTTQYHSRAGDILGRSLDLTSTLVVDGRTDINNQLFVSTTNDQIAGFTGSGTASTGSLSLYYYKRDNTTAYVQDKTMLYLGGGQTGGLIYAATNASASHLWHVGGFNSTSSERMRLSSNGLRINLASDLTTNGAAASDDLQVGGNTYLNGRLSVNSNGGMLRLIGTDHSYIELYTTGTSARSGFIGFASASNKNLTIVNSEVTGNLALSTNNLTRVFVTSDGAVGINTSSPASGLDVNANSVFRSGVTISGSLSLTGASTLRGNANFLGNVVVGTGTSLFDLDVDGLARAKSYISSQTVSSAGSTNLWFELGYSTLTAAYADETVCLLVSNRGGSNSNDTAGMAQVIFRVKQPNVMSGFSPVVDLLVPWSAGVISSQDFVAVVTQDDASAKVIKLMARLAPNYDELRYTVFNQTVVNNTNEFTLNNLPTGSATLITGVASYTGIGGFYTSPTGAVGIGTVSPASGLDVAVSSVFRDGVTTSGNTFLAMQTAARVGVNTPSPASGLDVNDNAVFRSGVTISGALSLNTITTTGTINANSLNVSGNASVTGALSVSGLTSLNTLTTTGVVNANSLNVSGDSIISGNLGVYNTATFENLVADPASTNLALRSQDFSTTWASLGPVTVGTSSAGDTPTGSGTSNTLTANGGNAYIQQTITVTSLSTYTFSVWLRGSTSGSVEIQISANGTDLFVCNYTTSWQRFSVTRTIPAATTTAFIRIGGTNSFASPEVIYAWGAQFENKPYATSYIPTVSSAVSAGDALELKYPLSRTVVANNLEVNGTLGVSGLTSLNTLTTTGVVNANSLNVSGNASVTGTLSVSGTTSLDDMLVTGAATFRTGVTVSGTLQANNVTGIVVSGNSSAGSGVGMIIKNDAVLGSAYLALISETNSGNVFQNGGTLNLSSPTNVRTLSNTFLAVSGSSTFFSANNTDASFRNNLTVSGALAVSGTSTLRGNLGVSGTTTLSRTVTTVTIPASNIPTVTTSVTILGKFALIRVSAPSVVISTAANTEPIISGLPVTFDLDQEFIVRVTHNSTPIATLAKVFHNGSAIAIYKNLNGDTNFSTSESVSWAALTFLVAIQ